jgi:predicted TIM-barrel fold metal-dependent hydrolase
MRYSELRRRLTETGFDVRRVMHWASSTDESRLRDVWYNIASRAGKLVLISVGDRGEFFRLARRVPPPPGIEV